ncbi:transposase, partial [Bacteroidales bacterium OttesenSCG-928-C03]|nr:transposase [Bacteroidales bacterium OttesenSCG-928-C03]
MKTNKGTSKKITHCYSNNYLCICNMKANNTEDEKDNIQEQREYRFIRSKRFYNLSDEQTEYQIIDRLSFRDFLGLSSGDRVPDARSIWLFQENLIKKNLEEKLFAEFHDHLDSLGL